MLALAAALRHVMVLQAMMMITTVSIVSKVSIIVLSSAIAAEATVQLTTGHKRDLPLPPNN